MPSLKRYLPFVIIAGVALATLGSGAILYWTKRSHPLAIPRDKVVGAREDEASMHIRGNPAAPVTLEEFGDFQCPPCGLIATFIDQLVAEYQPRLRLVFRNFPLPNHKNARAAALAAEAAGLQGRFWEMHDLLYREQDVWSETSDPTELFNSYAGRIKLDLARFKKDMAGEKAHARVAADMKRGEALGLKTTPTLFVNNRELIGEQRSPTGLRAMINAALKGNPAR
jgi:protein-disulfide isomerase